MPFQPHEAPVRASRCASDYLAQSSINRLKTKQEEKLTIGKSLISWQDLTCTQALFLKYKATTSVTITNILPISWLEAV